MREIDALSAISSPHIDIDSGKSKIRAKKKLPEINLKAF